MCSVVPPKHLPELGLHLSDTLIEGIRAFQTANSLKKHSIATGLSKCYALHSILDRLTGRRLSTGSKWAKLLEFLHHLSVRDTNAYWDGGRFMTGYSLAVASPRKGGTGGMHKHGEAMRHQALPVIEAVLLASQLLKEEPKELGIFGTLNKAREISVSHRGKRFFSVLSLPSL